MIEVTSATRTPAKRLLNNWHDSREVRTWTLCELSNAINLAISEGLITREGVERVLNAEAPRMPKGGKHQGGNGKGNGQDAQKAPPESEVIEYRDGNGEGEASESEGDGSGDKDDAVTGNPDYQRGSADAKAGRPNKTSEKLKDGKAGNLADALYDEGYSDGMHESEGERGEQKQNGNGQDQSEQAPPFDPAMIQEMIDRSIAEHQKRDGHAIRKVIIQDGKEKREITGSHMMLPDVLRYIKAGLNVALVGPAGTGKSTIAHQCAELLEKEFRGCGALLSKYDLVGFIDAGGTYQQTPLYDAYTNGHLFCFDELDASAPDAVVAFNAITDNQNIYAFPNGMHAKHAGFVAVACMNTWGAGADADYVGRYKQDAAAMSRFVRVYIDYDRNIEEQLGDKDIVARVWSLRDACKTLGIRHVVSTRMIIQAQAARDVGTPNKAIDRDVLFAGLTESTIKQIATHMRDGQ